jgi:hypothetical protein
MKTLCESFQGFQIQLAVVLEIFKFFKIAYVGEAFEGL